MEYGVQPGFFERGGDDLGQALVEANRGACKGQLYRLQGEEVLAKPPPVALSARSRSAGLTMPAS
jgi:hypothetical protein